VGVIDKPVSACELAGFRSGVARDCKLLAMGFGVAGRVGSDGRKAVKLSSVLHTL
jgi:hypothetical protein